MLFRVRTALLGALLACGAAPPPQDPVQSYAQSHVEADESFQTLPRVAERALRIAVRDVPTLGASVVILGSVNAAEDETFEGQLAHLGGTHYGPLEALDSASSSTTDTWADTPESACGRAPTTDPRRPPCAVRRQDDPRWQRYATTPSRSQRGPRSWLVFRVPPERWSDLPEPLRPREVRAP